MQPSPRLCDHCSEEHFRFQTGPEREKLRNTDGPERRQKRRGGLLQIPKPQKHNEKKNTTNNASLGLQLKMVFIIDSSIDCFVYKMSENSEREAVMTFITLKI